MINTNFNVNNYYKMVQIRGALNSFMRQITVAKAEINSNIASSLAASGIGRRVDITV